VTDLAVVMRAVDLLASYGLRTWVAGGWGEELRGLVAPRLHRDVDLLYPGRDLTRLDALGLDWIAARRRPHRRGFDLDGATIDVLLVERDRRGWHTGNHRWPPCVFAAGGRLPVASATALTGYRASYGRAA
jgi:Aminoglycoside-2''-adenylyltransferase